MNRDAKKLLPIYKIQFKAKKRIQAYKLKWNNKFEQSIPSIIVNWEIQESVSIKRFADEENKIINQAARLHINELAKKKKIAKKDRPKEKKETNEFHT
jgi:hypothetical protein